jgi:hypothetical protein
VCNAFDIHLIGNLSGHCVLYETTGYYCPGCGGTRAVDALLRGHWWKSLFFHPVVVYTTVILIVYSISHTLNIITREKVPALMFKPGYFYVMIGIILLQWIIKNAILFFLGIHIM